MSEVLRRPVMGDMIRENTWMFVVWWTLGCDVPCLYGDFSSSLNLVILHGTIHTDCRRCSYIFVFVSRRTVCISCDVPAGRWASAQTESRRNINGQHRASRDLSPPYVSLLWRFSELPARRESTSTETLLSALQPSHQWASLLRTHVELCCSTPGGGEAAGGVNLYSR